MNATIEHRDLAKWADYLINHSLGGVGPGDVVMVKGEHVCWPLLSVLQDRIFAAGAIADMFIVAPDNDRGKVWGAAITRHGSEAQIEQVPDWNMQRYQAMNKYVEVLGAESPELFDNQPDELAMAVMRADEPTKTVRLLKKWVITLYPTQGFADMEEMSLADYTDVLVSASTVDPKQLEAIEEPIHGAMTAAETIRLVTEHPENGKRLELSMTIGGRNVIMCTGIRNFPDGEVFTSPDANTVEGEIFVDMPVFQGGSTIQGIFLRLEKGVITEYSAEKGHEALAKIIETDEGSHRLGEVALGMNSGIKEVLRHPLFVEKVGGTAHIAIGSSYPECYVEDPASDEGRAACDRFHGKGILNRSAQHVDIVTDFRPGGAGCEAWLDDTRLEIRDGIWVVA